MAAGGHRPVQLSFRKGLAQHGAPSPSDALSGNRVSPMTEENESTLRFGRIAATLPVRDIERAKAFYVDLLGFRSVFENGNPTGFVILQRDDAELHLTLQKTHKAADFNVAHMMVENIDGLHELVQGRGLKVVKRLQDKDYGLRAFVFEDPDGNRIDVGQPI
jgi:catechol 2,3-dioxygenase-like lactoylglutathione lyase family enzyme